MENTMKNKVTEEDYCLLWKLASAQDALAKSVLAPVSLGIDPNSRVIARGSHFSWREYPYPEFAHEVLTERIRNEDHRELFVSHVSINNLLLDSFEYLDQSLAIENEEGIQDAIEGVREGLTSYANLVLSHIESCATLNAQPFLHYPISISGKGFTVKGAPHNLIMKFNESRTYGGLAEEVTELANMLITFRLGNSDFSDIQILPGQNALDLRVSFRENLRLCKKGLSKFGLERVID